MEEVLAAGGSGKICGITKAPAEAEAGAGNKAAAEAKPAEGKKRKTKTMRVKQEYIDSLLKEYPFESFPGDPEELEKNISDPRIREQLRVALAPATAAMKAIRDKDEAVIKQYLAQGYAEEEVEISDDDDEEI